MDSDTPDSDTPDSGTPRPTSRRSVLGLGLGLTALTATPLGSLVGLTGRASATGHGPAARPTDPGAYIAFTASRGSFPLVAHGRATPVLVSDRDWPGVVRVAGDLRDDIERVTGVRPALSHGAVPKAREITIIGTVGRSPLIDRLVAEGRLDVSSIRGRWETSLQTVVDKPLPGVERALVIAGSDQRGTVFGAYDVSRGIGVSPWYWWDDVVPVHRDEIHVLPGRHTQGTPAVKYRGFFINDENPALGTWAPAHFGPGKAPGFEGGFNADFYARVFEVMLRLKANYLWPAVWGRAFAEDDPLNHATAKAYGVVMGTSHEAPMMRGIEEWNRHAVAAVRDGEGNITTPGHDPYGGTGEWSFRRNAEALKAYWAEGISRMKDEDFEGVVTLGMRGNGDVSLPDGDGIELMTEIIATQRKILAEVSGRDVTTIPQVWTLYKEVQRYWDRGLRVPDDVTVVLTDDNWANIRKLPDPADGPREGGYGLYYHFDYVGVGRNYKWVDTTSLPNMWDQLHQCAAYGNHGLWVTNAGDLKGNELPTQFFLEYAWDPERWTLDRLPEWEETYARQNFGERQAAEIAAVLRAYARLQARRKPELLNRRITLDPAKDPATDSSAVVYDDQASPFSLVHYRELGRVTEEWRLLGERAARIGRRLPASAQDAWYELVGYEVAATANLYALREAEFTNIHYASQGRALTNALAATAEARLADDFALADRFNTEVADGKWQGFQTQPHIDYGDVERYGPNAPWQQPEIDNVAIKDVLFPAVTRIDLPAGARMGVAVDGSTAWWPHEAAPAVLPVFSPYQTRPAQYIEVFNRGRDPFDYRVRTGASWLTADRVRGRVTTQDRITLRVDWDRAPKGVTRVPVTVGGPDGAEVVVTAVIDRPALSRSRLGGFVEAGGYVSIAADHYHRAVGGRGITWQRIPDIGRTGAGMEPFPVTAARQTPGGRSPRLEYRVSLFTTGPVTVHAYLSPRNNALPTDGLTYAVSFDDDAPQRVNVTEVTGADDGTMNPQWARNTSDNVTLTTTAHRVTAPGTHVLKFWMVDPTVVLQNLVIDTGGLEPSYLGPPESLRLD
ncbi:MULTISPECIES: glycosyl hydrolase 115 family protein [unclassified Streptomyces]|uniref:glycosyl hydrolase 115 family protein n=1 Tax=unclassified Streptomyces TaxID=2593676 RepID=UPI002ED15BA4|nr:glycosyl hydrolase 115 family protein [Streptomyces sp. NBC_00891]WSY04046.1 glycosyl hydrolase 115 family protein [Streptomyces sp. NBC_00890]WSZ05672.1 glycosyl hydrolase 115 family protein [Streptomyces sp. NBC_00869]WSZ26832.1 glycosyl hydrolase 115 family protein [Streptomyces sp. NBC_00870]